MRIVADLRFCTKDNRAGNFYLDIIAQLTQKHKIEVLAISDSAPAINVQNKNLRWVNTKPETYSILSNYRQNKLVNKTIREFNPQVAVGICEVTRLKTSAKKCIILPELPEKNKNRRSFFSSGDLKKGLSKASSIVVFSSVDKKKLTEKYNIEAIKIFLLPLAVHETFLPVNWDKREQYKEKYSNGYEYFFFPDGFENEEVWTVLKAFSDFKKWQRSSMKIIIAARSQPVQAIEKLNTYKYKSDVIVLPNLQEEDYYNLLSASYAVVYPKNNFGAGIVALQSLQCRVPIIIHADSIAAEVTDGAALSVNTPAVEEIATHMKTLYKDEKQRIDLIEKGENRAQRFNWDKTLQDFYDILGRTQLLTN